MAPPLIVVLIPVNVPAPTASVVVEVAVGAVMVIALVTARVFVPSIVIPPEAAGALKVMLEAAVEVWSTVTVIPLLMVTASFEPGTLEPPQVAVLLQLPLTEAVLGAA